MIPELLAAYRRERQEHPGMKAQHAIQIARDAIKEKESLHWTMIEKKDLVKFAIVERGPFRCIIKIYEDYDHNWLECRGKFTDQWKPRAVPTKEGYRNSRTFKYYIPAYPVSQSRKGYIKEGYSKGVAQDLAEQFMREDMKVAADPAAAGYNAYGIQVSVKLNDVEIGEHSCWGYETKLWHKDPYLEEEAMTILEEALATAKKNLKELQAITVEE